MDYTILIIIGILLILIVGAFFALNHYRKRQLEKLFNEVFITSKQIPKQKKNSFLLLMFKESMPAKKSKSKDKSKNKSKIKLKDTLKVKSKDKVKTPPSMGQLNNPKYLEIQLIQMSNILKDSSKVKDKRIKNALRLHKDYLAWEKVKLAKEKQEPQKKAS